MDHTKSKSAQYLDEQFQIDPSLERFDQKNDIFNRAIWDDTVKPKKFFQSYDIANYAPKKSKGFDHWDYAFRNASWHMTDVIGERHFPETGKVEGFTDYYSTHTPGPPEPIALQSTAHTTRRIKQAAEYFGSGMTGICRIDQRWVYSKNFNRQSGDSQPFDLPENLKYAIIMIIPMDHGLSKTYPAAVSGASTGLGYTTGLSCANTMAQFITNLGFEAVAALNDSTLSIPMAIEAGLGEYGRHGLLINPKYGPNIRIAKVFTDLPLDVDQPIEFGVKQFCELCRKCADSCPVKAIPQGEPQDTPPNFSSLKGLRKWTVNAEKCFKFWVGMNTDCAICIRVCPYNKDYSKWYHRLGIRLANSPFRRLLLWLDHRFKFDVRIKPETWWS